MLLYVWTIDYYGGQYSICMDHVLFIGNVGVMWRLFEGPSTWTIDRHCEGYGWTKDY